MAKHTLKILRCILQRSRTSDSIGYKKELSTFKVGKMACN